MLRKSETEPTSKPIGKLLPRILKDIGALQKDRPDLIVAAWAELIGERFAPMAKASSFEGGVLTVKVRNSSLLSLLVQHEKPRLLRALKEKFPSVAIRDIRFNIG